MDRMVTVEIGGVTRYLNYSIDVMFDVTEKYGSANNMLDVIAKFDREGFEALRWILVRMANDGELCRRQKGYDHTEILKDDDIPTRLYPYEYTEYMKKVADAANYGYMREIPDDENEEIDLGLQELESKNPNAGA